MNVLVTGGAGFIGSHICDRLKKDHHVTCVDNLTDYYNPAFKVRNITSDEVEFIKADILDFNVTKKLVKEKNPEVLIHMAAQPGVRHSVSHPRTSTLENIRMCLNVLDAVRGSDVKKVVYASSSSVYGNVEGNPISPYGVSKLACEHMFRVYGEIYGLKSVGLRYFTVYGPRLRPDLAIHKFITRALCGGELEVYGDGSKSRDYTYVDDAVDATVNSITKGNGVYDVGGGKTVTVKELAEYIIKKVGKGSIKYVPDQQGDVEHTRSRTTQTKTDLGWTPKTDFYVGLDKTIEWMGKNV